MVHLDAYMQAFGEYTHMLRGHKYTLALKANILVDVTLTRLDDPKISAELSSFFFVEPVEMSDCRLKCHIE